MRHTSKASGRIQCGPPTHHCCAVTFSTQSYSVDVHSEIRNSSLFWSTNTSSAPPPIYYSVCVINVFLLIFRAILCTLVVILLMHFSTARFFINDFCEIAVDKLTSSHDFSAVLIVFFKIYNGNAIALNCIFVSIILYYFVAYLDETLWLSLRRCGHSRLAKIVEMDDVEIRSWFQFLSQEFQLHQPMSEK